MADTSAEIDGASALLAAMQLADSFFPSGMYTQSHGLERFISAGLEGEAHLEPLLHAYLRHVAGPGEALAARWAARAAATGDLDLIVAVDARLEATKLAPEGRLASRRCGGRVAALGADLFGGPVLPAYAQRVEAGRTPGHQAVALALAAVACGLGEASAVLIELHSFAVSLVSAAVRLSAIDHVAGQRLLIRVRPTMALAAAAGEHADWREIGGFAPQIEIMQFQHRYDDLHLFVS
ncbi:MAG: urease accessory UreF family protein [Chloroflexales bacterium]